MVFCCAAIIIAAVLFAPLVPIYRRRVSAETIRSRNAALPGVLSRMRAELTNFEEQIPADTDARYSLQQALNWWADATYYLEQGLFEDAHHHANLVEASLASVRLLLSRGQRLAVSTTAVPEVVVGESQVSEGVIAGSVAEPPVIRSPQPDVSDYQRELRAYCERLGLEWTELNEIEKNTFFRWYRANKAQAVTVSS